MAEVDDACYELTLTRKCADVGLAMYLLRVHGDRLSSAALGSLDLALREAVEEGVREHLDDDAWVQCGLAVCQGGLGMRSASDVALPAALGSLVAAQPLVGHLASGLEAAGLAPAGVVAAAFEERIAAARERLLASTPPGARDAVESVFREAPDAARAAWGALCEEAPEARPSPPHAGGRRPGTGIVPRPGTEDEEFPDRDVGRTVTGPAVQRRLLVALDGARAVALAAGFEESGQWDQAQRFREVRAEGVDHTWLWPCSAPAEERMTPEEFNVAVRLRLGSPQLREAMPCPHCPRGVLDARCLHALTCASAEATKGHNRLRDVVMELAATADPSAETEPRELVPGFPLLRPADILCAAAPGGLAAVDIGVSSPTTVAFGDDCAEAYRRSKVELYRRHLPALEAQGIRYVPITWAALGRPHPDAAALLARLARRAARRRGLVDHQALLSRTLRGVGVALQRRAARQVLACLPRCAEGD